MTAPAAMQSTAMRRSGANDRAGDDGVGSDGEEQRQ
jgi:hypothetical protein